MNRDYRTIILLSHVPTWTSKPCCVMIANSPASWSEIAAQQ